MDVAVFDAIVLHKRTYEAAIEYLAPIPKPSIDQVRNEESLIRAYVYGVIMYCLFKDQDAMDFLFSDNKLYTFDFADGFQIDDFSVSVMENAAMLAHRVLPISLVGAKKLGRCNAELLF